MNSFAAHAWNAYLMLERALPVALKSGAKRAPRRFAPRCARRWKHQGARHTHGVMTMSKTDHMASTARRVMVQIKNGGWTLAK